MVQTLYHGSKNIIAQPIFGYGKKYNDYGSGFYCTPVADMAREWAVDKDRDGYMNIYTLPADGLSVLNLSDGQYTVLNWLAVLLQNRTFELKGVLASEAKQYLTDNFLPDYETYDVIIGYRADDSYFSFAEDFLNGAISYGQLAKAMHLGRLGQQIVLKSRKSFERINFVRAESVPAEKWFYKKVERDSRARREYLNVERRARQKSDIYITKILDEEMKPNDPRLQRSVSGTRDDVAR